MLYRPHTLLNSLILLAKNARLTRKINHSLHSRVFRVFASKKPVYPVKHQGIYSAQIKHNKNRIFYTETSTIKIRFSYSTIQYFVLNQNKSIFARFTKALDYSMDEVGK